MTILIDTNIFINLEDNKLIDESFMKLYSLCIQHNHKFFIHPSSIDDINNDRNIERRNISLSKIKKYNMLENIPYPSENELATLGLVGYKSNDKIDNLILYALYKNSVNILITEDLGIIKKARRMSLDNRVMYVQQALNSFIKLHLKYDINYKEIEEKYLYELDVNDKIFNSLKHDYKEFEEWFNKSSQEQRKCWIHGNHNNSIGGILIYKEELNEIVTNDNRGLKGKVLKISTLKISDLMQGLKLGELFIKTVFSYANKNAYKHVYLTTKTYKQKYLVSLLEDFGFYNYGKCDKNRDDVYVKDMNFENFNNTKLRGLEFHKRYSPFISCSDNTKKFIIPIQPKYHDILFPEIEDNSRLFYTHPTVGNTIKKAYLSHANTNQMSCGDIILFYRSKDKMAITSIGIVEKTFKSDNLDIILEEVTKRTVYSHDEILKMSDKETHIILFRLVDHFNKPFVTKKWMEKNKMFKNCQSICQIDDTLFEKIVNQGNFNYCINMEYK